jgi:outer membrane protein TolC
LPPLPRRPQTLASIERDAISRRVDLQVGRMELDALARLYELKEATRFINILDAGYADKFTKDRETGARIRSRGFEVELQVPIFDFGEVRVRQAEQTYMQAVNRLAEKAVNVRSEARDAYRTYRSTYDIATHYQREVLPLRKIISDETMLRYGAMQIDVFALLAEARQRLNATVTAAEAKRDFWLAQSELTFVVFGGGAVGAGVDNMRPMAASEGEGAPH